MAVAIVLAGGSGSRMKSDVAKQYMLLGDKEVLYYSLDTFQKNEHITDIVLVTRKEDIDFCENEIVKKYSFNKVRKIVAGGSERYDSVYQGLLAAGGIFGEDAKNSDLVMIHDGARPFVTNEMIETSIVCACETGACTVGVPVKDTIKIVDDNMNGIETPDRKHLYQIQTPQTFEYGLIMSAYEKMYFHSDDVCKQTAENGTCPNRRVTDDTMLVEMYEGVKSRVILGSYENIKITTLEDINIAEIFAKKF